MAFDFASFFWSVTAAGGGATLIAYLVFKRLGESWLDSKFSERLEAFRHAKAEELEKFRAEVDGALRAKIRHQEKEFAVLSECWDLMNVAFGSAQSFASAFQQYQDIGRMSAEMRREYVGKLDILDSQKSEILTDADPTKAFMVVSTLIKNNAANNAVIEFNNCVYRNEIFIDEEIADDLKAVIKSLRSAVLNKQLASEVSDLKLGVEAYKELEEVSHPMILSIAGKLRSRIGSYRTESKQT